MEVYRFDPERALIRPRPYQQELIDALTAATARPGSAGRLLVELATGGGKRLVADDFLWERVQHGGRVLVVTKDWDLLAQLAHDLSERHEGALEQMSYVGGDAGRAWFAGVAAGAHGRVVYTTVHSWTRRRTRDFAGQEFDVVVIDEIHWGEGAPLYDQLLEAYSSATIVGLTATPRRWSTFQRVGRAVSFAELVGAGYLARPIILRPQATGIRWSGRTVSTDGDYTPTALRDLAADEARNRLIVDCYVRDAARLGPAIVFACTVEHAKDLAGRLRQAGVAAEAVHHRLGNQERMAIRTRFLRGETRVLVNVAMLTHGVDLPEVRTILLARPTTSDILMSQMIGRGSRPAPGKRHFFILDVVDNVATLGAPPLRPDGFLGSSALGPGVRGPALDRHTFTAASFNYFPELPAYEELWGLDVHPEQTFGIEFELSHARGPDHAFRYAEKIREALSNVLPVADVLGGGDHRFWNVGFDRSCGPEITTRVLRGFEGFVEVMDACRVIQRVALETGLRVDISTGTHVHLGWRRNEGAIRKLLTIAAYYEPALLSVVAPSRATSAYAASVRRRLRGLLRDPNASIAEHFLAHQSRYLAVNPLNLFQGDLGTIEVRLHSGTIEAPKILRWVSLWMRIVAMAETNAWPGDPLRRLRRAPLSPGPRGDIADLGNFVGASQRLIDSLVARRAYVVGRSWADHPKYGNVARQLLARWSAEPSGRDQSPGVAPSAA